MADALERRVDAYGTVLYGVGGLFGASDHVTAAEFRASHDARDTERRYPGVKVVGYADLLARRDVTRRTAQIRREIRASGLEYTRFRVHPATAAAHVAPITYMEPQAGNEPAFGLDFLSEPNRRAALTRTLESRRPEATAPVRLVQEHEDQLGFHVMLAVAGPDGKPMGAAYAAFRMGELVEGVVPRDDRAAGLEVYDAGPAALRPTSLENAVLTYDDDARRDHDALRATRPAHGSRTLFFAIMGRRWALYYAPASSLSAPNQRLLNLLPLILGAALAALAAWLLGASLRTERRAVAWLSA